MVRRIRLIRLTTVVSKELDTGESSMSRLELKVPPPLVALSVMALMWLLARSPLSMPFELSALLTLAVVTVLVTVSLLLMLSGVVSFKRASTTVNPAYPEKASQLVSSGVYRYTRNPMYLGMLILLVGWGVYLGSGSCFLLLPVFAGYISRFQIQPEERALSARFGDKYKAYQGEVNRWFGQSS